MQTAMFTSGDIDVDKFPCWQIFVTNFTVVAFKLNKKLNLIQNKSICLIMENCPRNLVHIKYVYKLNNKLSQGA